MENCLPSKARNHYITLRSSRLDASAQEYAESSKALANEHAAKGLLQSGAFIKALMSLIAESSNNLVIGMVQDAVNTCKLFEVEITDEMRKCLIRASEDLAAIKQTHAVQAIANRTNTFNLPSGAVNQIQRQLTAAITPMGRIRVLIETAYREGINQRKRMERDDSKKGTLIQQYITQQGDGTINATMIGDIATHQTTVNDFAALTAGISALREHFKSINTLEADEYAGILAAAQKAAQEKDESKLVHFIKTIPSKAWEVGKPLITAALSHFLMTHGIIVA